MSGLPGVNFVIQLVATKTEERDEKRGVVRWRECLDNKILLVPFRLFWYCSSDIIFLYLKYNTFTTQWCYSSGIFTCDFTSNLLYYKDSVFQSFFFVSHNMIWLALLITVTSTLIFLHERQLQFDAFMNRNYWFASLLFLNRWAKKTAT